MAQVSDIILPSPAYTEQNGLFINLYSFNFSSFLNSTHGSYMSTSEPDFFILGNKSYGRDPNFLLSLGLEQIRQLYCQISGDPALNLYESMQRNATSLDIP